MGKTLREIQVPSSLYDISLGDYQKYMKIVEKQGNENANEFINQKLIEIFCKIPLNEVQTIPLREYDKILSILRDAFEEKPEHKLFFTFYDVNMGFIPKLDEISLGEYIDIENNISDWQKLHIAMSVLYRPVNYQKNESYTIAPYTAKEEMQHMMKEMPLGIAMGAMVFFYDLGMELSKATLKYMEAHKKDKSKSFQPNQTSPLAGDGLAQFTNLAEEIYSSLTVLPHNPFSNV